LPTMIIFTSYRIASLNGLYTDPHIPQAPIPMSFCLLCSVYCDQCHSTLLCLDHDLLRHKAANKIQWSTTKAQVK